VIESPCRKGDKQRENRWCKCEGKNVWDDSLRFTSPYYLDVFIVHVKEQSLANMVTFTMRKKGCFATGLAT
jgi:hypothetical protein